MIKQNKTFLCAGCLCLAAILLLSVFFIILPLKKTVASLNVCYEMAEACYKNGFDKSKAAQVKECFGKALNRPLFSLAYKKSKFVNRSFYFSDEPQTDTRSFQKARCQDTLIAMYLTSVIAASPDEFEDEFSKWFVKIDFQKVSDTEFSALLLKKYNLSNDELKIVASAFEKLYQSCDNETDQYNTLYYECALINSYNRLHTTSAYQMNAQSVERFVALKESTNDLPVWKGYSSDRK